MQARPIATRRRAYWTALVLLVVFAAIAADPGSVRAEGTPDDRWVAAAPWEELGIDEPALPEVSVAEWTAAVDDAASTRFPASTTPELVGALAEAGEAHEATGDLQEVVLSADARYEIIDQLVIPTGVRLRGREPAEDFSQQAIVASEAFPADRDMVLMDDDTALVDVEIDGRDTAWRIVRTTDGSDFTISDSHLHGTNSRVGPVTGPFEVAGSLPHTDIIWIDRGARRVLIEDNVIAEAGIAPDDGGRGGDPASWSAFGAGIHVSGAADVTIRSNLVQEVATAGITLTRTERVRVSLNRIRNVARNAEWWEKLNPVILGDGITGYNHGPGTEARPEGERHWIIERNWIENSGNHGVHLSGMSIYVGSNLFRDIQGIDVFLGSTTNDTERYDCVEDVAVRDNVILATQYETAYRRNGALSNVQGASIEVRHYVDQSAGRERLVDDEGFSGPLQPQPSFEAADPDKRDCDDRMADP